MSINRRIHSRTLIISVASIPVHEDDSGDYPIDNYTLRNPHMIEFIPRLEQLRNPSGSSKVLSRNQMLYYATNCLSFYPIAIC
jgi:hypothetical protein